MITYRQLYRAVLAEIASTSADSWIDDPITIRLPNGEYFTVSAFGLVPESDSDIVDSGRRILFM